MFSEIARCESESMLTANPAHVRNASRPSTSCPTQTSTSGGSSETEVNEFAVNPCGAPPAPRVVTTVTPVTKQPSACRNAAVFESRADSISTSLTSDALVPRIDREAAPTRGCGRESVMLPGRSTASR